MRNKHTPGPWILNDEKRSVWSGETIIAAITLNRPQTEADARLIAAAPDLLKALRLCAGVCAGETMHKKGLVEALEAARAAIAKARGEA